VARPFWLKYFGPNGPSSIDEFRIAIIGTPLGHLIEGEGAIRQLLRQLDRPVQGHDILAFATPDWATIVFNALSSTPDSPGSSALTDLPSGTIATGPQSAADSDSPATIGVLVDWPWQVAAGFEEFTSDWEALNREEPQGWVENLLAQQTLDSPLLIQLSADAISAFAENPPFWANWARGGIDLTGDFSSGYTLPPQSFDVQQISFGVGNDYNVAVGDDLVAAGERVVVAAGELADGNHVIFDGSAETDGGFIFFGSDAGDTFMGGAGNDTIVGGGGGDTLSGGGGADIFVYSGAGDSTGDQYDTLAGFDPTQDRIDLPGTVAGFATPVTSGALSHATFDADLGAAVGGLGAAQAVWFAPTSGDLAGNVFLVVDANGTAGYQAGEDYVFAVTGTPLAGLTGHPEIFI